MKIPDRKKNDRKGMLLVKRDWCYAYPPATYGIECPNDCTHEIAYSEYKDRIWCPDCKLDLKPAHWGVFDGPIPVNASAMMGVRFDKIDLKTDKFYIFDVEERFPRKNGQIVDYEADPKTMEPILHHGEPIIKEDW